MASPALTELMHRVASGSPRDQDLTRTIFDTIDADGSGGITVDELKAVFEAWDTPMSDTEIAVLMAEVDADENGEICFDEFEDFLLNLTSDNRTYRHDAFQSAFKTLTRLIDAAEDQASPPEAIAGQATLTRRSLNPCIRKMRYEVRGEVAMTAQRLAHELASGAKRNFDEVLFCNIGNPHAVGQTPITFYRQVLALCDYPDLLDHPEVGKLYAPDAVERARSLTADIEAGTGAYTHSQGLLRIRRDVAAFIERRDGYPAHTEDIVLTNGASSAITSVLQLLAASPRDAVLIPIPQYPIYSALIQMLDAKAVGYHLDEEDGWGLRIEELERAVAEARAHGQNPRAMVLINPGNPTGQLLESDTLAEVARFCKRHRLVLLADEVYQDNVYRRGRSFVSMRKVLLSLGDEARGVELFSFHSTSKGFIGECGRRGGYMELVNIDDEARAELFKLLCVGLCSNTDGQIMVHLMVTPPAEGSDSHATFHAQREAILASLRNKSARMVEAFNRLPGIDCQPVDGAMYVFPRIDLPRRAIEAAHAEGRSPDMHYCLSLLEATGICTVPGSGFGQEPGTYHLRMTFLPPEANLERALEAFAGHHRRYLETYA
ncbi:MAG: aminotransferase class I/II-fold pyridoxal phosphate-dependent enzyme [Xanthomonadales bacterium]|nr:aminotransferase class I/II-fold pyridoxal phosphate-dependent enzyme [Xanthomonadales bacterium]